MIMSGLFIAHLIGDFTLQHLTSARLAHRPILRHAAGLAAYLILFLPIIVLFGSTADAFAVLAILAAGHLLLDIGRVRIPSRTAAHPGMNGLVSFFVDLLLHATLLTGCGLLLQNLVPNAIGLFVSNWLGGQIGTEMLHHLAVRLLAYLFCFSPTAALVKRVFDCMPPVADAPAKEKAGTSSIIIESSVRQGVRHHRESDPFNTGYLIGILERFVILTLGFSGQLGAIGFVIAAKSLARFNQLNDRDFAEKYLVGTLLSVAVALACITGASYLTGG